MTKKLDSDDLYVFYKYISKNNVNFAMRKIKQPGPVSQSELFSLGLNCLKKIAHISNRNVADMIKSKYVKK